MANSTTRLKKNSARIAKKMYKRGRRKTNELKRFGKIERKAISLVVLSPRTH